MSQSRGLPLLVLLLSLVFLLPGITQPMITMKGDLHRQSLVAEGKRIVREQPVHPAMQGMALQFLDSLKVEGHSRIYERTQSAIGLVGELWRPGYRVVALLVVTFSVIIPFLKCLLLAAAAFLPRAGQALRWNSVLSKWSMADVFAVGVLIACLAVGSTSGEQSVLLLDIELLQGFYWFIAYCLFSGLAGQWLFHRLVAVPLQEQGRE